MTTQAPAADVIAKLQAIFADTLARELTIDARQAAALARQIVGDVKKTYAGGVLYIPLSLTPSELHDRDTAIRRDFDGTPVSRDRLRLEWGVSRTTFYRIIAARPHKVS